MIEPSPALLNSGWRALTRTDDVGVLYRSNGFPRRLLVTFDALSEYNHLRLKVTGERIAVDCEADHLHISTSCATWFQSPDILDAIKIARACRDRYDEAILYGHSMGAYGALLLSGPLAATNVVAFSPQFSIDPARAPFEDRFRNYAEKISFVFDDMLSSISRVAPKQIVFDPFSKLDRQHFEKIVDVEGVRAVRIPFAGHYPGQMLNEGGVLRHIASSLILLRLSAAQHRQCVRVARRRSHRYFVERAVHICRRGNFKDAVGLVSIAYILSPNNSSVLETFQALLHSDVRYYGLAHAILRLTLKDHPSLTYYEKTLADLWREMEIHARLIIDKPMSPVGVIREIAEDK